MTLVSAPKSEESRRRSRKDRPHGGPLLHLRWGNGTQTSLEEVTSDPVPIKQEETGDGRRPKRDGPREGTSGLRVVKRHAGRTTPVLLGGKGSTEVKAQKKGYTSTENS